MDVIFVGLDGAQIPLEDSSVDGIACTWTLCTIPRVGQALEEMARVLRPGGRLHFIEHGASQDPRVLRQQDRWNPVQKALAGGCHLNRAIDRLVASQFEVVSLERFDLPGPRFLTTSYLGRAIPRK